MTPREQRPAPLRPSALDTETPPLPARRGSRRIGIGLCAGVILVGVVVGLVVGFGSLALRLGLIEVELPEYVVPDMEPTVQRAFRIARQNVIDHPTDSRSWEKLASTLDAHELQDEAIVCYQRALSISPDESFTRYCLGVVLELTGRPQLAQVELERVAREQPSYAPSYFRLGELHFREGRNEEARRSFARVLEIAPDEWVARRRLGQVLLALGDADGAIRELQSVSEVNPKDRPTTSALAQALGRAGRREEAERLNTRLAAGDPDGETLALRDPIRHQVKLLAVDSISCTLRAEALEKTGDYLTAIAELKTAAEARPDRAVLQDRIGRNYIRLERPSEAIPHFDLAVAIDPTRASGYHNRALAHERLGNLSEAIADYKRALIVQPDHPMSKARLQALGQR